MFNRKITVKLNEPDDELKNLMGIDGRFKLNKPPRIFTCEYPNICLGHKITDDEIVHAMDVIATYFMQTGKNGIEVILEEREKSLTPAVEMTMEEIEKKLGHKVKIVGDKEDK